MTKMLLELTGRMLEITGRIAFPVMAGTGRSASLFGAEQGRDRARAGRVKERCGGFIMCSVTLPGSGRRLNQARRLVVRDGLAE